MPFSLVRSDPFCNFYKKVYKEEKNKPVDKELLNKVRENLKAVSTANGLAALYFDKEGRITLLEKSVSSGLSEKRKDLIEFASFIEKYLKEHPLHEKEAREIRELLYKADQPLVYQFTGMDAGGAKQMSVKFRNASQTVLMKQEEMQESKEALPGEKKIIAQFKEKKEEAEKELKKRKWVNHLWRAWAVTAVGGVLGLCTFLLLSLFVVLPPLTVVVPFLSFAFFIASSFIGMGVLEKRTSTYSVRELAELNKLKGYYDDKGFIDYVKALPEAQKQRIEERVDRLNDLYELYTIEKKSLPELEKVEKKDYKQKIRHMELEKRVLELKHRLEMDLI